MSTLLAITASPRGPYSASTSLTHTFVESFQQAHPGTTLVTRDLITTDLPFIDLPWIMGAYTPAETHSPDMTRALAISNTLIAELQAADHIVIGTPMYNFTTPAILKAWLDHVVRVGVTFSPSYEGLLKNKKVTVIIAAAGNYSPGAYMEKANFETAYLKHILGFIGLTDVTVILAGGTSEIDQQKISREDFLAKYIPEVQAAAQA